MDKDEGPPQGSDDGADGADGTAAVLYAIFVSFTEALGDLEDRLAAIEAAVRSGPADVVARLDAVEAAVRSGPADVVRRLDAIDAAVDAVRALVQARGDDAGPSLGRRATDAGRRLASDLGLVNRPRQPPAPG